MGIVLKIKEKPLEMVFPVIWLNIWLSVFLITTQAQQLTLPPAFLISAQPDSWHSVCVALKMWPGRGDISVPDIPYLDLCSDAKTRYLDCYAAGS